VCGHLDPLLPRPLREVLFAGAGTPGAELLDQTKAIELTPKESAFLHYHYAHRGDYYLRKGDYELAVQDYTEAIRLKPDYKYHYSDRAKAYRQLGKPDLAEADEQKAGENEPSATSNSSDSGKTISGGVLNSKAVNLVKPPYPPAAKAVRAAGAVNVQVTIDENGNVISASAISGHPLLKPSAVAAARQAKFSPTKLSGQPVKVTGVLVYNFVEQ